MYYEFWKWRRRLRVNARKIGKSGEPWYICHWMSFIRPFFIGPVFFRTALPCSGGYHLQRGGMPLHDAVGINCIKGATTKNQMSSIWAKGCMLIIVRVLFDLTWPPLLSVGRKSWFIILIVMLWFLASAQLKASIQTLPRADWYKMRPTRFSSVLNEVRCDLYTHFLPTKPARVGTVMSFVAGGPGLIL